MTLVLEMPLPYWTRWAERVHFASHDFSLDGSQQLQILSYGKICIDCHGAFALRQACSRMPKMLICKEDSEQHEYESDWRPDTVGMEGWNACHASVV